ncbi:MAG: methylated-DNA--[protein]-cysteine S-methyltransferase [Proteobacteria bacterium]|nr:methylated-DNA--[protein]-cysteine S-methyltransferase [Pseudomonadota bacterium]
MNYHLLDTTIGTLRLVSNGSHLRAIEFPGRHGTEPEARQHKDAVLEKCATQLTEYFAGERSHFDLPLDAGGTEFQQAVWAALVAIPFGELRSYADIANSIGRPKAVRAVGAANGRNPIPIVVPCHRVIGSDGSLTGFAGGLPMKTKLLTLEGALLL